MVVAREEKPDRIENIARALLRPALRLLYGRGLARKTLEELCDEAYVSAAAQEQRRIEERIDLKRVSELSGVSLARTKRHRAVVEAEAEKHAKPVTDDAPLMIAATRVMTGWYSDPGFTRDDGSPLPCTPNSQRFKQLVKRHGNGFTASAIGGLLLSTESVRINDQGEFVPQGRYILAAPQSEELEFSALEAFVDLARAVETNQKKLLARTGVVQRTCSNERMPLALVPRFHALIRENTQSFLETIDDWLLQHEGPDEQDAESMTRLGVGVYVIADD